MSKKLILGLAAACILSACDNVRLPGSEVPEAETPVPTETTSTEATESTVSEASVTVPEPETVDNSTIGSADPEPVLQVGDLAAINAQLCGLPIKPLDDSLTLAELTGAEPADPDLVGTATINGMTASLIDFPGLVKMEPREFLASGSISSGHCGATRISETWFITAAHCLDDDYDEVSLVIESETLSSPLAKRVNASASVCHGAYGGAGNNYVNDIALIRVSDEAVSELSRVPIASFGETQNTLVPFNYSEARMAGWGLTDFRGSLSDTLLSATLKMTGTGPAAIGVLSQEGAGPCVGDSGGPLYVTEEDGSSVVVGVLSVVEQNLATRQFCEGDYGARYTNLQGYGDWIESVISTCENGLGLCGF